MTKYLRLLPLAGLLVAAACDGNSVTGVDGFEPVEPNQAVAFALAFGTNTVNPATQILTLAPAATDGDLLIAHIAVRQPEQNTQICAPPGSGWVSAADPVSSGPQANFPAVRQAVFYRKVTASEAEANYTFSFRPNCSAGSTHSKLASAMISKFSGVDVSGDPILGAASNGGFEAFATAPAVANVAAGSYVLRFFASTQTTQPIGGTWPVGSETARHYEFGGGSPSDQTEQRRIAGFGRKQETTGSTGAFEVTIGTTAHYFVAQTIVLKELVAPKTATAISDVSGSGVYGGTATLTATLKTAGGVAIADESVSFTLDGEAVCGSAPLPDCPTTDDDGVATLAGVSLAGYGAGSYTDELGASFTEDADYLGSTGSGDLTVTKADQTLTWLTEPPATIRFGSTFNAEAQGGGSTEPIVYSLSGDCSFTGTGPITVTADSYTGNCTVKANRAGDDNHNAATELSKDVGMLPALTTVTVSVIPTSVQYSDLVDLSATVAPCTLNGEDVTGSVTFYIDDVQVGSAQNLAGDGNDCTVGITGHQVLLAPSATDYEVKAVFTSTNDHFLGDEDTEDLTVTKEDAEATYTGLLYVSTASTTSGSFSTQLSATIEDITAVLGDPKYDAHAGDITNARVTFRVEGTAVCSNLVPVLVSAGDTKTGTVICPWSGDLNGDAATYTVRVEVNGYYQGNDQVGVTVARGTQNSITGGGFFINDDSSAGTYAATEGLRTNFGFNVKFNAAGRRLQGQVNLIFRIDDGSGEKTYQIKSNAIDNLTGDKTEGVEGGTAMFQSKGNLTDVTNPDAPVSIQGNLLIQMEVVDGNPDQIRFTLRNSSGQLMYASAWNGVTAVFMDLVGGNIVVR